jgi:hypothetical protein
MKIFHHILIIIKYLLNLIYIKKMMHLNKIIIILINVFTAKILL